MTTVNIGKTRLRSRMRFCKKFEAIPVCCLSLSHHVLIMIDMAERYCWRRVRLRTGGLSVRRHHTSVEPVDKETICNCCSWTAELQWTLVRSPDIQTFSDCKPDATFQCGVPWWFLLAHSIFLITPRTSPPSSVCMVWEPSIVPNCEWLWVSLFLELWLIINY